MGIDIDIIRSWPHSKIMEYYWKYERCPFGPRADLFKHQQMASLTCKSPDIDFKIFQLDKTDEVIKNIRLELGDIKYTNKEIGEDEAQEMAAMQLKLAKVHKFKEV